MAKNWTAAEIDLAVADYMAMLAEEKAGHDYSKAEHRQALSKKLDQRSSGSIEFKHQNISAVLNDLGHEWVPGYKPAANYQALLRDRVVAYLAANANPSLQLAEDESKPLDFYIEAFRVLEDTKEALCPRSHKVCMLLSTLDLVSCDVIQENCIRYDVVLADRFTRYFEQIRRYAEHCEPYRPYFHLREESFWQHQVATGQQAAYAALRTVNAPALTSQTIAYTHVDPALFSFFQSPFSAGELRAGLIDGYLAEQRRELLALAGTKRTA